MTLAAALTLLIVATPSAQVRPEHMTEEQYQEALMMLDSVANDSTATMAIYNNDQPPKQQIFLLPRTYRDKICLRWAPSDYVVWTSLNKAGYVVLRSDMKSLKFDTIAVVKPMSLDGFKTRFGADDDLAGAAAEVVWGDHTTPNTDAAEENHNPMTAAQAADDYDQVFSSAMMLAELRFDLAEAMGLGYTDRKVQKGQTYMYIVKANMDNKQVDIWNNPVFIKMDEPFKPKKIDVEITDSVGAPCTVKLYWPWTGYSSYDIERRQLSVNPGDSLMSAPSNAEEWQAVNKNPYMMLKNMAMPEDVLMQYTDAPPCPGVYEYRLVGYDPFGDKSLPSDVHRVTVTDMVAPMSASLTRIVVDYPDVDHTTAHIYFAKDTIEADLKGFMPMYRARVKVADNPMLKKGKKADKKAREAMEQMEVTGEWQQMSPTWLSPTDTVFHCDVSGLPSGDVCIMAADTAGNVSQSLHQFMFLRDYKAPTPPDSLRANVSPNGLVVLRWKPSPELDVRYYEMYTANDTTHTFMKIGDIENGTTMFVDSIAPGLNQAYIYYEMRAVDYSGNMSQPSRRLQVVRPNFIPPHMCRIDSLYNDETHVYMRWIQPDENDLAYTRLLRRKRTEKDWEVIGVYPADSVRAQGNFIRFIDHPVPDMKNRYEYCMEAYNLSGVSSGFSLVSSVLHAGPKILNLPIALMGNYRPDDKETVLAWELKAAAEAVPAGEWWYCIYRKGPDDDDFKFLLTSPKDKTNFSDFLLAPGQSAEYYVKIRLTDGRFSKNSNTIKVTATNAK